MPAGRPSKLTPEAIEKAWAYVNGGYEANGDVIPSHIGIAFELKVNTSTVYHWANEGSEEFSKILEACKQKQHQLLIGGGLSGEYNASIAKLVLGKHGYHERQEHSGPDGQPVEHKITSVTFTGPDE